ncbi:hypothetical protein JKP88DRAFT_326743 [Tribonema minus]|uniref:ubiquitinyl hydrolase 1 n=1 Tax=Tribonema minus TaxID=303371 RepID=A0A836CAV1_9STRA|nr:hypothetical protein JKP88DRAFT_326743 [Tribonema minus]
MTIASPKLCCRFAKESALRKASGLSTLWVNPFKSAVPFLGYYDLSVLVEALQTRGVRVSAHVAWNPAHPDLCAQELTEVDLEHCVGLIINCRDPSMVWRPRHWLAVARIADGTFVNCDSKLLEPQRVGGGAQLLPWLLEDLRSRDGQAFFMSGAADEEGGQR